MNKNKRKRCVKSDLIEEQQTGTTIENIVTSENENRVCLVPGVSLMKSIHDWIV